MTKSIFTVLAVFIVGAWLSAARAADICYHGTVKETESSDNSGGLSVPSDGPHVRPDVLVYVIYPRGNLDDLVHPETVTDDEGNFRFFLTSKEHFIALLFMKNGFVMSAVALEKFDQTAICGGDACNWDNMTWERDGKRNYHLSADVLITHEKK